MVFLSAVSTRLTSLLRAPRSISQVFLFPRMLTTATLLVRLEEGYVLALLPMFLLLCFDSLETISRLFFFKKNYRKTPFPKRRRKRKNLSIRLSRNACTRLLFSEAICEQSSLSEMETSRMISNFKTSITFSEFVLMLGFCFCIGYSS